MTSGSAITGRVSKMHASMTAEPLDVHGSPTTLYAAMADRTAELVFCPGDVIAYRLGILTRPSDGTRAAQLKPGLGLATVNADGAVGRHGHAHVNGTRNA